MAPFARVALSTLTAALALVAGGAARADEGKSAGAAAPAQPVCKATFGENAAGLITLPSNAPAILVTDTSTGGRPKITASLVKASGERIALGAPKPDANGLSVLAIPPSTTGAFTLDLEAECETYAINQIKDLQIELGAASVPPPTTVGTLSVLASGKANARETIVLEPSEGMRAFLPAAVLSFSVGGLPAQPVKAGTVPNSFTAPVGQACVENGVLLREKRTLKVSMSARIAGVAQLPEPATMDLTVDCGAIQWTDGIPDDGTEPPGGTTGGAGTTTTTGGCAASPVAPNGALPGAALAAVAIGAVVARMRRRRT
ncbi:MAG: hypothetical protein JST00_07195 [Deltaproteobacteria bacterium]|nr:hypothetical protein [Deltaproteobacteria bacterium]